MTTLADLVRCKPNDPTADVWIVTAGPKRGYPARTFAKEHLGVTITRKDLLVKEYLYYLLEHLANQGLWSNGIGTGEALAQVTTTPTGGGSLPPGAERN
jgi:hypothetical protein